MVQGTRLRNYLIQDKVGVGTFATVYCAKDLCTGQKVAIKFIPKYKLIKLDLLGKISREINILKRLKHDNIIRLIDVLDSPFYLFIITEFVQGGDLFDHISSLSRLTEEQSLNIFRQIFSAVDYYTSQMVVHRDLKPENIMLTNDLVIKLGDFGFSRFILDGDFLRTPCGSPNYASPEIISGRPYSGPEVDIWSLGIILYVLMVGELPFDDEDMPSLFAKIKLGKYTIPGFISQDSKYLLSRMLDVNPKERATFDELRAYHLLKSPNSTTNHVSEESQSDGDYAFPKEIRNCIQDYYNKNVSRIKQPTKTKFILIRDIPRWQISHPVQNTLMYLFKNIFQILMHQKYSWSLLPSYKILCKKNIEINNNPDETICIILAIQVYKVGYQKYSFSVSLYDGLVSYGLLAAISLKEQILAKIATNT